MINQIEKISKLINDIEEDKFSNTNFEDLAVKNNQKIEDISLTELLNYWEKAKHEEK